MLKILLISCILILLIAISGCTQTTQSIKEINVCGDNICGATEDCNNCPKDCGCKQGEYCSDIGVCRTELCGNEICSPEENTSQSCCEDCGCLSNKICNKVTQTCQEKATISENDVRKIANNYMSQNNITGTITNITDSYYKESITKQVSINCKTEEINYPCVVILYIDNSGKILEEIRTA